MKCNECTITINKQKYLLCLPRAAHDTTKCRGSKIIYTLSKYIISILVQYLLITADFTERYNTEMILDQWNTVIKVEPPFFYLIAYLQQTYLGATNPEIAKLELAKLEPIKGGDYAGLMAEINRLATLASRDMPMSTRRSHIGRLAMQHFLRLIPRAARQFLENRQLILSAAGNPAMTVGMAVKCLQEKVVRDTIQSSIQKAGSVKLQEGDTKAQPFGRQYLARGGNNQNRGRGQFRGNNGQRGRGTFQRRNFNPPQQDGQDRQYGQRNQNGNRGNRGGPRRGFQQRQRGRSQDRGQGQRFNRSQSRDNRGYRNQRDSSRGQERGRARSETPKRTFDRKSSTKLSMAELCKKAKVNEGECVKCGRSGHYYKDCRTYPGDLAPQVCKHHQKFLHFNKDCKLKNKAYTANGPPPSYKEVTDSSGKSGPAGKANMSRFTKDEEIDPYIDLFGSYEI